MSKLNVTLPEKDKGYEFKFKFEYGIVKTIWREYKVPIFDSVSVKEIVNGQKKPVTDFGKNFGGYEFDEVDALGSIFSDLVVKRPEVIVNSISKDLKDAVEYYSNKGSLTYMVNGVTKSIPLAIPYGLVDYSIYTLFFVTDKYVFYLGDDEEMLCYDINMSLLSDNNFAADGFEQCVEAVKKGEESLIYGEDAMFNL